MATTTAMEHDALMDMVCRGPDEAAAAAVTAFAGDINARSPEGNMVLQVALAWDRPLTIAALVAREDCNPNVVTRLGTPVLCQVVGWLSDRTMIATFLAQFPTLDVNACSVSGCTPLHYAARYNNVMSVQLLLDAGADPTIRTLKGVTPAQAAHGWYGRSSCTELLEAAEAWHRGVRREWLRAVVGMSKI